MATIYKGRIFTVGRRRVRFDDDHRAIFDFVYHKPAAAVVAYLEPEDSIILVRQKRFAVGRKLWEIPAGLIEKDEKPAAAARRELEEETGFRAGRLEILKTVFSSPGFTDETTYLYMATELKPTATNRDRDEELEVRLVPRQAIMKEFAGRSACDAKTLLSLHLALPLLDRFSGRRKKR